MFISNEDLNHNNISLTKSGELIHGAIEIVKHEIKKREGGILPAMMIPMAASLIVPMDYS